MVLPAPPLDDEPGEGAWISAIRRELSLTSKGLILLVDRACPAALRDLVRALLPDYPDLDVHTDVQDVYSVPEGSVMVLAPRAEDADWLNVNRPVFARRGLKVILWCDEETTAALARNAVDFFDWVSHRHECPPAPPLHGVFGIRTALCARAAGIQWIGGDLEACFRAALPGREIVRVRAGEPFPELVRAVRAAGSAWVVWDEVDSSFRAAIVQVVLAEAGRRSRVIVDGAQLFARHRWPTFHGQCESLRAARRALGGGKAPGRLAALTGLEPEAIDLARIFLERYDEERSLETILRESEDPGAALAKKIGIDPFVNHFEHARFHLSPPMMRAFGREKAARAIWGRELWGYLRYSPKRMASYAAHIARLAAGVGPLDEAEALARRAVQITEQVLSPASPEHAEALCSLAGVMTRRGRFREAETLIRRALEILKDRRDGLVFMRALHDLADVLSRQGRYAEAEEYASRALEEARGAADDEEPDVAEITTLLHTLRSLRARSSDGSDPSW